MLFLYFSGYEIYILYSKVFCYHIKNIESVIENQKLHMFIK